MRLVSFRVMKYRSIEDSGEVTVDENVTTFVGTNESGKTNLMRALKKINQADLEFDDVIETPNWHFGSIGAGETFVKAEFKLDDEEIEQIVEMTMGTMLVDTVTFSKDRGMKLHCHLHANPSHLNFNAFRTRYLDPIIDIIGRINMSSFENGQSYINAIADAHRAMEEGILDDEDITQPGTREHIVQRMKHFQQVLDSTPRTTEIGEIYDILAEADSQIDNNPTVQKYLIGRLPQFIYFENTAIIDSRIHLPTFISKIDTNTLDEKEKTIKTLLDLGNLDAHDLSQLTREDGGSRAQVQKNKTKLRMILEKASEKISDKINGAWSQNEHDIKFDVQGDDLGVLVKNKSDGVELQLEEKSRGYQWFFSFYAIFNAESEQRHKDAIILLDEPALFLHPKGQSDFIKTILPELAIKNQILYTTHSPFMVDLTKPRSIHTVTLKDKSIDETIRKTTCVSGEVWDNDRDALFPLQSALHYTMAQSMFIGNKNLFVEGITDYWLLKGLSEILEPMGRIYLDKEVVIVPAAGATKIVPLVSMYKSQELNVAVLLDADREGKLAYDRITKNNLLHSKKVLLLSKIYGKTDEMSIEDIFPEDFYLKYTKIAYQKELQEKGISEITLSSKAPLITKRLECFFKENGLDSFHKTKPACVILSNLGKIDVSTLPTEMVKGFETLFERLNATMQLA